jgi:large subunit ribosomal protein L10
MPSQKNIDQVNDLKDKLSQAKAVFLADHSGLSVSQQRELHQKIKDSGGQFLVAKNRLFKLAFQEKTKNLPPELEDVLKGPTAFLFAPKDEIGSIKALVEFSDQHNLPQLKLGLILDPEDKVLSVEDLETLAKLPTRDQLITQLIGTLNAPKVRFVSILSGNLEKLTFVLNEIKNKKESN